jgi:hypothetical protein
VEQRHLLVEGEPAQQVVDTSVERQFRILEGVRGLGVGRTAQPDDGQQSRRDLREREKGLRDTATTSC